MPRDFFLFTALSVYLLYNYSGLRGYTMRGLTSEVFVYINLAAAPLVLIFAASMTISNISLIRHEGFRFANMLGMIISVFMTLGTLLFNAELLRDIFDRHVYAVLSAKYVLFETYLLGTGICAVIAARHTPAFDKDYLIILGCGIKEDGILYPLLRGRVDKAIAFYHRLLEATGKKAVFVPSGGQGSSTKWYFWPNAFVREFAGLLVNRRVKIVILFVVAAALSLVFTLLTK